MLSPRDQKRHDALADASFDKLLLLRRPRKNHLERADFTAGLSRLGADAAYAQVLFRAFDADNDDAISRNEFRDALRAMSGDDVDAQALFAFRAWDTKRDGRLDADELTHVILAAHGAVSRLYERADRATPLSEPRARAQAEELLRRLDEKRRGYVTRDDFVARVRGSPGLLRCLGLTLPSKLISRAPGRISLPSERSRSGRGSVVAQFDARAGGRRKQRNGTAVFLGHANWELMLQMMIGISISLSRACDEEARRRRRGAQPACAAKGHQRHFDEVYEVELMRPATMSAAPRSKTAFFKDYAPMVFRRLRAAFGVDEQEYARALGPDQVVSELLAGNLSSFCELLSEGKSGSFFYFSSCGRYLIKTVPHREARVLRGLLPSYCEHVEQNPHTLLPRFLSFHRLRRAGVKVHFVVMANVFSTDRHIDARFDLKGSTIGRLANPSLADFDVVRKDRDLVEPFHIGERKCAELYAQLKRDVGYLREQETLDYSLLVGVSYPKPDSPISPPLDSGGSDGLLSSTSRGTSPWMDMADGGIRSAPGSIGAPAVHYVGIIDILTGWSPSKLGESVAKQLMHPTAPNGVSCVPPSLYAKRFETKMVGWFV